jgi:hypothetical protein
VRRSGDRGERCEVEDDLNALEGRLEVDAVEIAQVDFGI